MTESNDAGVTADCTGHCAACGDKHSHGVDILIGTPRVTLAGSHCAQNVNTPHMHVHTYAWTDPSLPGA